MSNIKKLEDANQFRQNIRKIFEEKLDNEKLGHNLEIGIYNATIQEATHQKIQKKWSNSSFVQLYMDKLRSIYVNLKNEDLLGQLKNGDLAPQQVAFMTHQEMNPNHWKELIERKIKRDASKYVDNAQASTDMFTCKKCKSKRCTYYELQTRSADEPATVFITCLDCGKHWKS
jgi:transcription elongation factor S-II